VERHGQVITSMTTATAARARTTLAVATAASVMGTNPSDDVVYMGETLSGNDAIVKYTYVGDFNLDGKVNGDDYFRIDNGYGAHATGYDAGDSDFSGSVNADDYFGIDRNYGAQGPPL
jgi:hypothetical protein